MNVFRIGPSIIAVEYLINVLLRNAFSIVFDCDSCFCDADSDFNVTIVVDDCIVNEIQNGSFH